ncbi:MAG: GIY-YIG nuclease family protein [Coriobacteriia bacterium]|nr:GIY-YIG nuclease family protein [Coriobacteriia bacterium]
MREYKESSRSAGIFQVANTVSGRLLLGPTPDLPGMLNRQRFQLEMGSHPDKELQTDWNDLGPDAFEFSVLDELEPHEESEADLGEDLRVLHQMWLERLFGTELYRQSVRGA